jgi:hypothetical protein
MQIILGTEQAKLLEEKYVVLELDRIVFGNNNPTTAYCVVQNIGLFDFVELEKLKKVHQELISNYRNRHWDSCLSAINQLTGKFAGDLDTFYSSLLERVTEYQQTEPPADWTDVISK